MGINDSVPITDLTSAQARAKLGIGCHEKTILFFGTIRPYKGLEYLVTAFQEIAGESSDYRLLIVGDPMNSGQYWQEIQEAIEKDPSRDRVIRRIEFIADSETEIYFKAADVSVLPYNDIFQSGVLVLAYSFGLPVIATDVGSLRQDIAEGKTGFICRPRDPVDIARAIKVFFESDLYKQREENRQTIREYARKNHSWDAAGEITSNVYTRLLRKRP
jgi:glycosyltransferase involved in cell wall biosynthesis